MTHTHTHIYIYIYVCGDVLKNVVLSHNNRDYFSLHFEKKNVIANRPMTCFLLSLVLFSFCIVVVIQVVIPLNSLQDVYY